MAEQKTLKTRIQSKHDTQANWTTAGNASNPFIPLKGEIIIYDSDSTYSYPRIKVGNGTDNINQLPFITSGVDTTIRSINVDLQNLDNYKADKATTLAGYGITDAKIENGTITLGTETITPITSHQDISGKQDKITSTNKLSASLVSGLATVATSGSYNDLSNKPTIPTKVSQLTNDSGYTTNTGTVTSVSVKLNGTTKGTVTTSGTIDLGNVVTSVTNPKWEDDIAVLGDTVDANEYAMKTEVNNHWDIIRRMGYQRHANEVIWFDFWEDPVMDDPMMPYYLSFEHFMTGAYFYDGNSIAKKNISFKYSFPSETISFRGAFQNMKNEATITFPSFKCGQCFRMFYGSKFTKILVADNATCLLMGNGAGAFEYCSQLTEIGEFDMSNITSIIGNMFSGSKIKTIRIKNFPISFSISDCGGMTEAADVELVFSNLKDYSGTTTNPTITISSSQNNLNPDKTIATNKNWNVTVV